jgi:hypothetical protein
MSDAYTIFTEGISQHKSRRRDAYTKPVSVLLEHLSASADGPFKFTKNDLKIIIKSLPFCIADEDSMEANNVRELHSQSAEAYAHTMVIKAHYLASRILLKLLGGDRNARKDIPQELSMWPKKNKDFLKEMSKTLSVYASDKQYTFYFVLCGLQNVIGSYVLVQT